MLLATAPTNGPRAATGIPAISHYKAQLNNHWTFRSGGHRRYWTLSTFRVPGRVALSAT